MKRLLTVSCALALASPLFAQQANVQVQPPDLHGSRQLEKQTGPAVVRDYIESWEKMSAALDQNQPALLNADFVGLAREKLAATIKTQSQIGIHSRYLGASHNLQIVFYSPEGQSIQLIDHVEYDEQVLNQDKVLATQHMKARCVVVLTPAETRWKVRIFQASPE
ncbi:MAG TPA: hypothetical protein VIY53_02580 [Acidobacteriaceae bacterium]